MSITVTDKASEKIREHLKNRGKGLGVRVGVKTTGCSGYAYVLEFADESSEYDTVFEHNGATIVIDAKSLPMLAGIQIDFVRNGLNEGFEFSNPNSKGECGCGESFTV
jgi:iron-sulfur cluster assembly protein